MNNDVLIHVHIIWRYVECRVANKGAFLLLVHLVFVITHDERKVGYTFFSIWALAFFVNKLLVGNLMKQLWYLMLIGYSQSYLRMFSLVLSLTFCHLSHNWAIDAVHVAWLLALSKLGHIFPVLIVQSHFCFQWKSILSVDCIHWHVLPFICETHICVIMWELSVMPWQDLLDVAHLWA